MPKIALFVFICSVVWISCCKGTADECISKSGVQINFSGFSPQDLDTVYTTGYQIGTGFGTITQPEFADTSILYRQPYTTTGQLTYPLRESKDWKVYIPSIKRTYYVYGYKFNKTYCKNCAKRVDVYNLDSCWINDTLYDASSITFYKQ
jgi:hypothetical protein